MPKTMTTPGRLSAFDCRANRLSLRMNVAPGHAEIAVAGEVGQRVRVHVCRPARQARVTEGVQRERLDFGEQARAFVLLLWRRFLSISSGRVSREHPLGACPRSAHFE